MIMKEMLNIVYDKKCKQCKYIRMVVFRDGSNIFYCGRERKNRVINNRFLEMERIDTPCKHFISK